MHCVTNNRRRSLVSIACLTAALGLVISPPAVGQELPEAGSVVRPGHGEPVCGLGKAFHAGRRAELRERIGEGVLVFRGLPARGDYLAFQQDKTFWYLTGINSAGAALVMDAKSGKEILFLPAADPRKESWDGELWDSGDDWVRTLTGFDDVRSMNQLVPTLDSVLGDSSETPVWVSLHPAITLAGGWDLAVPANRAQEHDPLDGRLSREQQLKKHLETRYGVTVNDARPILAEMRLIKQPEEIAALKRAGRSGALAMAEAMRSTRPGLGEWDIGSLMSFVQVREGATGPGYQAIVGSGPNSCVLHYPSAGRIMNDGEVLLIDYGPEVDFYVTDITRTWPVNGKFSDEQAKMYDAVLAAQTAAIEAAKPGLTMGVLNQICNQVLREHGYGGNIRHGACHWIGMEVHDVGGYRMEFKPGMALTVEPGAYNESTGVGVRIEDVIVITEDGCEVITRDVPVERDAIEKLIAEKGVLDIMDGK